MKLARVILFTAQIDAMSRFHGEVLGLRRVTNEQAWKEFSARGARIALHSGPSSPGRKSPKIVFHAKNVAALPSSGAITPAQRISYEVRGTTFTLLLPDGTGAIVNCQTKILHLITPPNNVVSCRVPLVDDIHAEFTCDKAKLVWVVSLDGKSKV